MKTQVVGILNLTPDSFSRDGFGGTEDALDHVCQLLTAGAPVVDVGAESTRPNAVPLTAEEEWRRLAPVLPEAIRLSGLAGAKISLDTRHAANAKWALALGVGWINDVSGGDAAMLHVLASSTADYVLMHSLGVPAGAQTLADDCDVVAEVKHFFAGRLAQLQQAGIHQSRVILDPGIGFGKSARQCWELLARVREFGDLGCRLLVGHSRKSFMKIAGQEEAQKRDEITAAISAMLAMQQVDYVRVHDVPRHMALLEALA